ncbi:MAG: hypothetical protein WC829_03145 [Hyphomicrobium sp.]|jgi:hypothetical protein
MSGGHFNYSQFHIQDIAESIGEVIRDNDSEERNEWGERKGHGYTPETIDEFKNALIVLRVAHIYAQRCDWLLSCDDGEDSFHKRLKDDLSKIEEIQ